MPRQNPHRPFTPDPEQVDLWPELSGNKVNGLGENSPRQARMVYWAPNPETIPHGALQTYFYGRSAREPAFGAARAKRQLVLDRPLPDRADKVIAQSPQDWTGALKGFVASGDCEITGVADMRKDWIVEGHEVTQKRVIMLGVRHDYTEISQALTLRRVWK